MNVRRGQREVSATRLRIGQNCRAVCTKKSGLNASGLRDALLNDRRENAAHFERPAKQVLALATEPRAKREARSFLYHTRQWSGSNVEQSENVAIAHVHSCYAGCGLCNRFHLRMRTVLTID